VNVSCGSIQLILAVGSFTLVLFQQWYRVVWSTVKEPERERLAFTTGFRAFVESRHPLSEGLFPHSGAFTESLLSAKGSRRTPAGEGPFVESRGSPSLWMCAERSVLIALGEDNF
jgi:hypothetical protein